jgi:hypothetical protein
MIKASLRNDDSMEAVVRDVIRRSCALMPDRASAERLTEAVLLRAIAENTKGQLTNFRLQLMALLDEEHRLHGRRFLN